MLRPFYDPSDVLVTNEYAVSTAGDQFFIPGNNQAYGDNPDAGTMAQRRTCNESVIGTTMTETDPESGIPEVVSKGKEQ